MNSTDIVYSICVEDIQNEAKSCLGRELNENELSNAIELLEYGLGESLVTMYSNIFNEISNE